MTTYQQFLEAKTPTPAELGRAVEPCDVHPMLFPHQRAIVEWAVKGGRRAIFAAFGLGKSVMQLETLRLVTPADKRALIICPLGVRAEFRHDADLLGIETVFVRRSDQVDRPGIYLTNYESVRDGKLDPNLFTSVSLDEASVLRSYGSKTYQEFLTLFNDVEYRYVATATPSPNRYKELIHYAGFLGVMDTGQALTRFFQRDSSKANNLTLYPHKEQEFWHWLASWAVFLQTPADLGFPADGYDLPELTVEYCEIEADPLRNMNYETNGQGQLVDAGGLGVSAAAAEKRASLPHRVAEAMRLVDLHGVSDNGEQVVLWCDLNDEQRALERALDAADISYSSVYGSLSIDETERRIAAWKARDTTVLIGKPVMLGQGLNLQQCNRAIFVGLTHKFNDVIQAVHRIYRFGQTRECFAHIVHTDRERSVVGVIKEKWQRHKELTAVMSNLIREHGLNTAVGDDQMRRSMGVERVEVSGEGWTLANNDCVLETESMDDNSVGLVVTSIPFSNHYEYTPSYNDFGHTDNNDHFWAQMDFLTPQLLRILEPGRVYCCHVKDRILFGNTTGAGAPTVSPFHAEAIGHGIRHGFDYMGMITITTDVVRENNQSYRLGWSEMSKDGTKMGVGSPEYLLLFRKPQTDRTRGYADEPVVKDKERYTLARWQIDADAFWRSSGDRQIDPETLLQLPVDARMRLFERFVKEHVYDFAEHVRLVEELDARQGLSKEFSMMAPASNHADVWTDVNRMLTLNTAQSQKRQALHVCPLQFDIVDRCIERWSNAGDLVFDPFGGIGTVPYRALLLGRRGRSSELNPGYFLDSLKYLRAAEQQLDMPTLFDMSEVAS